MQGTNNYGSTKGPSLKIIQIIHVALLAGQVLFAMTTVFISRKLMLNIRDMNDPFLIVAPVLAVTGALGGWYLYKNKLQGVDPQASLPTKLDAYFTALLMRLALLEAGSLFAITCLMLTEEVYFLVIAGIIMLYFVYLRPTADKIAEALNLNYQETEALRA